VPTAPEVLSQHFPPTSPENQEGDNLIALPPYAFRPTTGEATIGFNRDTMEDPRSYPLSLSSNITKACEERRSEGAVADPQATPGEFPVPETRLLPTRSARPSSQVQIRACTSGIPPPAYASLPQPASND
ncbi:hypothetical protein QBC32DRAFT_391521, partial [Pseudoneurospora amorphoporcata]